MKLRCSLLVIVYCLVMEFCDINQKEYLLFTTDLPSRILFMAGLGLMFLLYPLIGHLTDVYLTRYRSLKWSFGFLILAFCLIIVFKGIVFAASNIWKFRHDRTDIGLIMILIVYIVGLALFQANAIQFTGSVTRGTHTKTDCFHPLVLLGSECWQFGIILCYSWQYCINVLTNGTINHHSYEIFTGTALLHSESRTQSI